MGLTGKSFEEAVSSAIEELRGRNLVQSLAARVEGRVVTLVGEAPDSAARAEVMRLFDSAVGTENTINEIVVKRRALAPESLAGVAIPVAGGSPPRLPSERFHVVLPGETLGLIAQKYYGRASQYVTIVEANAESISDPDRITVGQVLRIP